MKTERLQTGTTVIVFADGYGWDVFRAAVVSMTDQHDERGRLLIDVESRVLHTDTACRGT